MTIPTAEIDITAWRPEIIAARNGQQLFVRAEIVDQRPEGGQPTGKYIHLGLTAQDAMLVLSMLLEFQKAFGLPTPQATVIAVPPAKERQ